MKKQLLRAGIVLAAFGMLAGCGKDEKAKKNEDDGRTVITYANWNLGTENDKNIERLMIDEFNKSQDKIKVKIDDSIDGDGYNDKMNTAASAGKLPDVFMVSSIPTSYKNEWLLDLDKFTESDQEFTSLNSTIIDTTKVNDQTMVLPFAKHLMGYFVNTDLLNKLNLNVPEPGVSVDEFIKTVKEATDIKNGHVGISNVEQFVDWYAGEADTQMGWYTFNNDKFQLNSEKMIQGVQTAKDLASGGYSFAQLEDEQKAELGEEIGAGFKKGHIAFMYDGSYAAVNLQKESDVDFEFIGLPGDRNAMTLDYLGISKNTKNAEAAYEFAKYMSFGKDGFMKRMELSEKNGLELATLPLSSDEEVNNRYWETVTVSGLEEVNNRLENAMFDPLKIIPGYAQARFEGETGLKVGDSDNATMGAFLNGCIRGEVNYQDYADQIQKLAQQFYEDAVKSMNE